MKLINQSSPFPTISSRCSKMKQKLNLTRKKKGITVFDLLKGSGHISQAGLELAL